MKLKFPKIKSQLSAKLAFVIVFAAIGSYLLLLSHAQTPYAVTTASSGNPTNGATTTACVGSSDMCVVFNGNGGSGGTVGVPTNLQIIGTSTTQVSLTWSPPTGWSSVNNNLTGYNVYRNGSLITKTPILPYITNYVDTALSTGTTYSYTVAAVGNGQTSAQTSSVKTTTGSSTTVISSCAVFPKTGFFQPITQSGNYILTSDLTSTSGLPCINFANASNINLDCQGHTIYGMANNSPSGGVDFELVSNVIVTNCNFQTEGSLTINGNQANGRGIFSNNITIYKNNFENTTDLNNDIGIIFTLSGNSIISTNTIDQGSIRIANSSNAQVNSNNITACLLNQPGPSNCATGLYSSGDSSISMVYNTINGNNYALFQPGATETYEEWASDDAINLDADNSDTVDYNTISNVLDCGIESGYGGISNSDISYNNISYSRGFGICGYSEFDNSMLNNTYENNAISYSEALLTFTVGDESSSVSSPQSKPFYFQNNKIIGNILSNRINTVDGGLSGSSLSACMSPQALAAGESLIQGNNYAANNNFDYSFISNQGQTVSDPIITQNLFVDGGGNSWNPVLNTNSECQ